MTYICMVHSLFFFRLLSRGGGVSISRTAETIQKDVEKPALPQVKNPQSTLYTIFVVGYCKFPCQLYALKFLPVSNNFLKFFSKLIRLLNYDMQHIGICSGNKRKL